MCLNPIENKFKRFKEKFIEELILLDSKYRIFMNIQDAKENKIEGLRMASGFFQIIENSLVSDLVISLGRLYEGFNKENNNYTFRGFLVFLKKQPKFIEKHNIDPDKISNHKKELEEKKDIINNLFLWRDKHYAHLDTQFFNNSEKLSQKAKFKFEDIRDLIDFAHNTVNYYFIQHDDGKGKGIKAYRNDLDILLTNAIGYKNIKKKYMSIGNFQNNDDIQNFLKDLENIFFS